jgi:hypothetical protein
MEVFGLLFLRVLFCPDARQFAVVTRDGGGGGRGLRAAMRTVTVTATVT